MTTAGTLALWVHPGSRQEAVRWDPWRRRWEVWCTAPAEGGAANRRVAELCALWLRVPLTELRIVGTTSRAKRLAVPSLGSEEAARRLAAAASGP